jgi:hypothetical protein
MGLRIETKETYLTLQLKNFSMPQDGTIAGGKKLALAQLRKELTETGKFAMHIFEGVSNPKRYYEDIQKLMSRLIANNYIEQQVNKAIPNREMALERNEVWKKYNDLSKNGFLLIVCDADITTNANDADLSLDNAFTEFEKNGMNKKAQTEIMNATAHLTICENKTSEAKVYLKFCHNNYPDFLNSDDYRKLCDYYDKAASAARKEANNLQKLIS